jgi:hypothetical protein
MALDANATKMSPVFLFSESRKNTNFRIHYTRDELDVRSVPEQKTTRAEKVCVKRLHIFGKRMWLIIGRI